MQQEFIHQILLKRTAFANFKSYLDKLDIGELKNVSSGLSSLKSKVDKLDIGKKETTPVDLSKASNLVKNEIVKGTEYNKLVEKVNNINTNDTSNLVKESGYNTKICEVKNKINDHDHAKYITTQEFNLLFNLI